MKTKFKISARAALALVAFICLFGSELHGQARNRWNLKVGYSNYINLYGYRESGGYPNLRFEGNYGINKYVDAGLYVGAIFNSNDNAISYYQYGLNVNLHILPFFTGQNNIRFDPYLTGKFGGIFMISRFGNFNYWEYGVGVGLAYYIWRKTGIFVEYTLGKHYLYAFSSPEYNFKAKKQLTSLRYGLSFRF